MKRSYLVTWPVAMLSLLIGLHMLFTMSPVSNEYNEAVKKAEIVKASGSQTLGHVRINYSYEDNPRMGSKYGADVAYGTKNGTETAWISMTEPIPIAQPVFIIYNEDIDSFAINANDPILPHEVPDEQAQKVALLLIAISLAYVVIELVLLFLSRIFKQPFVKNHLTINNPERERAHGIAVRILRVNMAIALICGFFFMQYVGASNRVSSVRENGTMILAHLSEKCVDRVGFECDGRYKALYQIDGVNYSRLFQVKGDIIYDDDLPTIGKPLGDTRIPLVYNAEDPRFSYALSSNEQVNKAYEPLIIFPLGMVTAVSLVFLLASRRQEKPGLSLYKPEENEPYPVSSSSEPSL